MMGVLQQSISSTSLDKATEIIGSIWPSLLDERCPDIGAIVALQHKIAEAIEAERARCIEICQAEATDEAGKWHGPEEYRLGAKTCADRIAALVRKP